MKNHFFIQYSFWLLLVIRTMLSSDTVRSKFQQRKRLCRKEGGGGSASGRRFYCQKEGFPSRRFLNSFFFNCLISEDPAILAKKESNTDNRIWSRAITIFNTNCNWKTYCAGDPINSKLVCNPKLRKLHVFVIVSVNTTRVGSALGPFTYYREVL